jgi:hypothetical protein
MERSIEAMIEDSVGDAMVEGKAMWGTRGSPDWLSRCCITDCVMIDS